MSPACQRNLLSEVLKNVVELLAGGVAEDSQLIAGTLNVGVRCASDVAGGHIACHIACGCESVSGQSGCAFDRSADEADSTGHEFAVTATDLLKIVEIAGEVSGQVSYLLFGSRGGRIDGSTEIAFGQFAENFSAGLEAGAGHL